MKSKEEFKEKVENGEFTEELKGVQSPEDVVNVAKNLGYDISIDDVLKAQLDEDTLSMIAGGKHDNITNHNNIINGNNNTQLTM